jgi:hypothetical protein
MDTLYFLVRFTPFWSIPVFMISFEFAYLFWLRKKKKKMMVFVIFLVFSALSTAFYYIAGGPEKSVRVVIELVQFYTL